MQRALSIVAGLALLAALALAGDAATAALHVPVPGAALGLLAYLGLLANGRFGWSLPGARWLVGWLGALIVAPLIAGGGRLDELTTHALPLALAFVAGVAITGGVTALLYVAVERRR